MKKIMIHHNYKKESLAVKGKLIRALEANGLEVVKENGELVIVIGGDGTMLSAIRLFRSLKVPFAGINTGTLGFLPGFHADEIEGLIDVIKNGTYRLQSYPLLKVVSKTINGEVVEKFAFNEILIKHLEPRLMEAMLYIDGREFNYFTGDGFIISTPIGATGYAIWAGGVAMQSELSVYQITPLNPNDNSINRPMMTSMVVPIETKVDFNIVKSGTREVIVACDGTKVSNDYISELHIEAAHREINILRTDSFSYYDLFRRKIIDKTSRRADES